MHANHTAATSLTDLVLERLPNGELGWLRQSSDAGEPEDALFTITDAGRRALAEAALFDPWPSVGEVKDRS
jgi:hypothetical protein